ncbi:putative carboxylesterase [Aspergillus saccharolyticus JOP 1030-1]|uniref:Carboxylic ester hydrolase n=1 Tax=Aspergillus saccharolyticus JOP 1030-1 TaxID=1450539 RepID=A0A319A5U2_9EURO|nr:putative carboxylesterase [Aspergillus saccharolyticus JOP 1030-1]PYH47428.1 putative carboxylesterase [Aspergillus saccharolyticus JOP 1030-1]
MEYTKQPCLQSLGQHGYIQGVTLHEKATKKPFCHYFGGVRYAHPPPERWRMARKLSPSYSYGSKEQPGPGDGRTGICPQPRFLDAVSEESWTEDCFQCNIWIPIGDAPKNGWPVLFFIHGGFLQFGDPNAFSAAALLGDAQLDAIVILPAYRLNVFGFLYSSELEQDAAAVNENVGNHGFWDQRLALEWTRDHIHLFGGNASEITVAGYSAGAYSTFYQLTHDLTLPPDQSIIKRVCIWSNSPVAQPKLPTTAQTQFTELLTHLSIPLTLAPDEKLRRLRALPAQHLLQAAMSLPAHNQFRPTTDGTFIRSNLFASLDDGTLARRIRARDIRILCGECRDERNLYATWFPPREDSLPALRDRLLAEYPQPLVETLLKLYYPTGELPPGVENWRTDAFGRVYADMQVHKMQRGLVDALTAPMTAAAVQGRPPAVTATGGAVAGTTPPTSGSCHTDDSHGHGQEDDENLVYRYRIEYRLKCADKSIPPSWGVTHATDQYIWFWGNGERLEREEKSVVWTALVEPLKKFVHGDRGLQWGTKGHKQLRTLMPDGSVQIKEDVFWDEAMRVWKALREIGEPDSASVARL